MSSLRKTFHTPKSMRVVVSDGIDRKRSLAVGCCSVAGRSLAVLAASTGIGRLRNAAGPTWPGKLSYSFCVVPVLCSLKSVKLGPAWQAIQLPIVPAARGAHHPTLPSPAGQECAQCLGVMNRAGTNRQSFEAAFGCSALRDEFSSSYSSRDLAQKTKSPRSYIGLGLWGDKTSGRYRTGAIRI